MYLNKRNIYNNILIKLSIKALNQQDSCRESGNAESERGVMICSKGRPVESNQGCCSLCIWDTCSIHWAK